VPIVKVEANIRPGQILLAIFAGAKGVVSVTEPVKVCGHCRGTGAEPENKLPCLKCRGKGVVTITGTRKKSQ